MPPIVMLPPAPMPETIPDICKAPDGSYIGATACGTALAQQANANMGPTVTLSSVLSSVPGIGKALVDHDANGVITGTSTLGYAFVGGVAYLAYRLLKKR